MVKLALAVLALAAGCKGDINAAYCAAHRDDPDCLTEGVMMRDAPTPECETSAQCVGDPEGGVCDTSTQQCVECLPGGESSCIMGQVCGADQKCVGCVKDGDCASSVCLGTRSCANEDNILYVKPDGTGTTCDRDAACTLTTAVAQLTATRNIIKLTIVPGVDYDVPPITINQPFAVQIIGRGVELETEGPGAAISVTNANVEIVGLTIGEAQGNGVTCTSSSLTLQEMKLVENEGYGLMATGCNVNVKRSYFSGHVPGAIFITGGESEIRNNVIHNNGNENLETGVVRIVGGTGRLVFNTIVKSISRGGGQRVGGVFCTEISEGSFAVAQNIIADPGDGDALGGNCTVRDNFLRSVAEAAFVSDIDFHLTAQSPVEVIRDVNSTIVDADCAANGGIDDLDGEARPSNTYCDRGADEYRP